MKQAYSSKPIRIIEKNGLPVHIFSVEGDNINHTVVKEFGEEWTKFKSYTNDDIRSAASMYFDILNENILDKSSYVLDIGCGNGRWTKYLAEKAGFVEAIEPGNAILAAAGLLKEISNVRLAKAAIESLPFEDNTFDLVLTIGVLHHVPDTKRGMADCIKKVKPGGYFYCYLYYNLETRNVLYKSLFQLSNILRRVVSVMPAILKFVTCDILAVVAYMPFILAGRILKRARLFKLARRIPLADYTDKSFFIIRNDSLDRFGTRLERRFSKDEFINLMQQSGLTDIVVSPGSPFYHAVGKKSLAPISGK